VMYGTKLRVAIAAGLRNFIKTNGVPLEMNATNLGLRMRYLSDEQVKKIHANAVGLLETHGFMVDADGRKMSKSQGNALEVEEVLKKHGADICRWWVSSLNYTNDIKVDWEFFKVASEEYRKVRNTIRFLLGNLKDFDPSQRCEIDDIDPFSVDAWAVHQLNRFVSRVRQGYEGFQFKASTEAIFDFCNDALSAVYLAAV